MNVPLPLLCLRPISSLVLASYNRHWFVEWRLQTLVCRMAGLSNGPRGRSSGAVLTGRRSISRRLALAAGSAAASRPIAVHSSQQLSFVTTESGLRWATSRLVQATRWLSGDTVAPSSRVTFHAVGRLVGKQGWVYMNTQAEEDEPYRLTMGSGAHAASLTISPPLPPPASSARRALHPVPRRTQAS